MRHIRLCQPEESAVAERKFETGHNIAFGNNTILDKYWDTWRWQLRLGSTPDTSAGTGVETPPLVGDPVSKYAKVWKEHKYDHGSQRNPEPRLTVL
jgi:hypothetical protein